MIKPWALGPGLAALVLAAALARAEAPAELRGHGGPVKAIALFGGGTTLVSGGFDSALIVWDRPRVASSISRSRAIRSSLIARAEKD